MKKWVKPIVSATPILLVPVLTSCDDEDKFDKYINFGDVLSCSNGWYETLYTDFGNSSTLPDKWGQEYDHANRECGSQPFFWNRDEVDNSQDGFLRINYHKKDIGNNEYEWSTGEVGTFTSEQVDGKTVRTPLFEQAFGYWELESKFLDQHYGWSAFWLQCNSEGQKGNGGEDGSEIDIFESFYWNDFQNEVRLNSFCDGYDGDTHAEFGTTSTILDDNGNPVNLYNDYHKFGLFWTPTHYYLTVDRQIVIKTDAQYGNHSGTTGRKMGICKYQLM